MRGNMNTYGREVSVGSAACSRLLVCRVDVKTYGREVSVGRAARLSEAAHVVFLVRR